MERENIYRSVREKNQILNRWEQYYRVDKVKSFPLHIQFPTGERCNLQCRFCMERKGNTNKYKFIDMNFNEFLTIVRNDSKGWKQSLSSAKDIALFGWGEPLINPDFEKIVDYLKKNSPGLGIIISTNGIMFDREWAEKAIDLENSIVNFSINAANRETYHRLMGSDQFEGVMANLAYLTDLKEKSEAKSLQIDLSYVVTTENIRELPQFVDMAADLNVDSIIVQDTMLLSGEAEKLSLTNQPVLANRILKRARAKAKKRKISICFVSFTHSHHNYFPTEEESVPVEKTCGETIETKKLPPSPYDNSDDCFAPWENFIISKDGKTFPCCETQDETVFKLGNIFKQSFQDIWNGEAWSSLRKNVNTSSPPQACINCPKKQNSTYY